MPFGPPLRFFNRVFLPALHALLLEAAVAVVVVAAHAKWCCMHARGLFRGGGNACHFAPPSALPPTPPAAATGVTATAGIARAATAAAATPRAQLHGLRSAARVVAAEGVCFAPPGGSVPGLPLWRSVRPRGDGRAARAFPVGAR